jgi:dsDNA-specific endonuclease/ATPase MutS2
MGNSKKHHNGDLDIKDLIKLLESENNQIESSFENIEGLLKRNEKLAEQLLGIRTKRGKY